MEGNLQTGWNARESRRHARAHKARIVLDHVFTVLIFVLAAILVAGAVGLAQLTGVIR
jgi:hypothetical protein